MTGFPYADMGTTEQSRIANENRWSTFEEELTKLGVKLDDRNAVGGTKWFIADALGRAAYFEIAEMCSAQYLGKTAEWTQKAERLRERLEAEADTSGIEDMGEVLEGPEGIPFDE